MKFEREFVYAVSERVAPLVGAWIEIIVDINNDFDAEVAPLVGAWIEINSILKRRRIEMSLLL